MTERKARREADIEALERELAECRAGIFVRAQELEVARSALEGQARTWQSIIESIADGVVVADESGALLCMNPAARRLLGEGTAVGEGTAPVDRLPLRRAIRGEPVDDFELVVPGPGGSVCLSANARPLRDRHGVLMGGVAVFRDVTEKKRLVAEIQAANRHKSEFLANMSHELRSPLNAIIGFTELLQDGAGGPLSGKQREYLGEVLLSSRHLLRLVNDVLDLAKVEAGKLVTSPERHELGALLAEVVQVLRALAVSKRLTLRVEADPAVGDVVIDGARLKQVLYNYVSNAIKFTPEHGTVTVRSRLEPGDRFVLEVEDTGIGVRAEDQKRLFVDFQQLDAGTAKKHAGTGLGLALTKRLVESLGGSVGVKSEPGRGSTFHAVLPRVAADAPAAPAVVTPSSARPRSAARAGARVLVVDDNPANLELVKVLLEKEGHAVRTAADAESALEAVALETPDLVLMDIQLPGMDGLELTRRMKARPELHDVPIVALTAYAMKGDEAKALGAGCDGYLTKPIDTRCFAGLVLGYIRGPVGRARVPTRGGVIS